MRHKPLSRLPKAMVVAHGKPQYTSEIRFVDIAKLRQFDKGDFIGHGHFASYVEFVDGLETGSVVLYSHRMNIHRVVIVRNKNIRRV